MFAGAAFTDQADIKVDSDVVDTLVSLGVVEGFEDGSFQPNATVTRAQMAKMIYVLRTGKSDASAYNDDKTSFTDIGSHWARGYIKYCQSLGIIAGKSSTIFAPNATVTAQEAAKMLLVTLGYDAEKAGLVGAGWAAKTNALADENGLLDDVNTSFTGPCPRQYAAQLIYNTLDANIVVWRDDAYTNVNVLGADNQTIGEKYMGLKYATGVLMASGKVGLDGTGASEALVVKADEKQTVLGTEYSKNSLIKFVDIKNDYSDLLGMNVKVMYKVYGVYATDDNDVNIAALDSDLDTVSGEAKFKVDDVKYKVNDNGMIIYTIGVDADGDVVINPTKVENTAADIKSKISAIKDNDMEITVVSNDNDEKVDAIFVNNKTFAKLTTVNSTSVSYKPVLLDMKGNTTGSAVKLDLEDDEPEVYDGYKKDDYVFVGADLFNDSVVIEKAQTISGKSESFKSDSIKIDGNWHDYVLGMKDANNKYSYTAKSGKTYTAYVYGSYVYYLTGESGSGSDVDTLLVKSVGDYQKMDKGVETKVYFEDGTEKVINVKTVVVPANNNFDQEDYDKDNTQSANNANVYRETGKTVNSTVYYQDLSANVITSFSVLKADTLYAYEQDGSDYTLFALNNNYASNDVKKSSASVSYSDKTETFNGVEADDAAPIFLKYSNDSYKVITGAALKNYKSMTGSGNSVLLADDDNVVAAYIDLGSTGLSSSDTLYGVVKKAYKGTESDGTDNVVYLDLITAEGPKTVETEETSYTAKNLYKGAIISFTGTYEKANDDIKNVSDIQNGGSAASQGYIAISNDWSDSSKLVRSYQGLHFNGGTAYSIGAGKVVSDSVIININEDGYKADDATPAKAEELKNDNGYYANAYVIVNSDNEIDLLVYETNNKIEYADNHGNRAAVQLTTSADIAALGAVSGLPTASQTVAQVTGTYTVTGLTTGLVGKVTTDADANTAAGDTVTATLTVTADTGYQLSAKAPALAGWTVASESASQWVYTMNITVAA